MSSTGKTKITLWKVNGTTVTTLYLSDGSEDTYGTGISTSGKDVFVSGYTNVPGTTGYTVGSVKIATGGCMTESTYKPLSWNRIIPDAGQWLDTILRDFYKVGNASMSL